MRLLDAAGARLVDRDAVAMLGLSEPVLMENAAVAVEQVIDDRFPGSSRVGICCGTGNNGGDGTALARRLHARGREVRVVVLGDRAKVRGLAREQLETAEATGVSVVFVKGPDQDDVAQLEECDLLVDAVLGTGLSRPVEGWLASALERLETFSAPLLSIDLASGLDTDRGSVPGPALTPDVTVTFFGPKLAHFLAPQEHVGELWLSRLTVPGDFVAQRATDVHGVDASGVELPVRPADGHKGSFGHVLVVGGSPGKSGAPVLTASAALRSGSGLVTSAVSDSILSEVDAGCVEAMTLGLSESAGTLGHDAADQVLEAAGRTDVLAFGPGLGGDEARTAWARQVLAEVTIPVVIDADGINAYAGRAVELRSRPSATVITPHPGELARLLGTGIPRDGDSRLAAARRAAELTGSVVVLKGAATVTAEPGGTAWVNSTGGPGMGTAGSGDVLTGVVASLLGQGLSPCRAARIGVAVHGLAGDRAAASCGEAGMVAGDIVASLPNVLQQFSRRRPERRSAIWPIGRASFEALWA